MRLFFATFLNNLKVFHKLYFGVVLNSKLMHSVINARSCLLEVIKKKNYKFFEKLQKYIS